MNRYAYTEDRLAFRQTPTDASKPFASNPASHREKHVPVSGFAEKL